MCFAAMDTDLGALVGKQFDVADELQCVTDSLLGCQQQTFPSQRFALPRPRLAGYGR